MRKITAKFCHALASSVSFTQGNTATQKVGDVNYGYLHNNLIAVVANNRLHIRTAGWESNTTKDRLNGLLQYFDLPYSIVQRNFIWYLYDEEGKEATPLHECYKEEPTGDILHARRFVHFNLTTKKLELTQAQQMLTKFSIRFF